MEEQAAKDREIPLELNLLGIRQKRHYPHAVFWSIAGEEQAPVTFGFDSHDVNAAYDAESLPVAEAMVKEYGLRYIGEPCLVRLEDAARALAERKTAR